jgi:hypothetical protein
MNQRAQKRGLLITAALAVWACVVVISIDKYQLAARSPMSVSIKTVPASIKLRINNRYYRKGYLSTPLKLELPSGEHKIKVSRDGYISHVMSVQSRPGQEIKMEDIVLEKDSKLDFFSLTINHKTKNPIYFELDDGLAFGETPSVVNNLISGKAHNLTFYPDWPRTDTKTRCRFLSEFSKDGDQHRILVSASKKHHLRFKGCRRLTKRKH